jgi:hypothetical protein
LLLSFHTKPETSWKDNHIQLQVYISLLPCYRGNGTAICAICFSVFDVAIKGLGPEISEPEILSHFTMVGDGSKALKEGIFDCFNV